ncbi:MAG: pseudaminic acid biosynthesis-associated protein PseG [Acidimicrobiales bacterium]|nr:pseudaminic acid biosynthesis-associated protein PseG [Acidimicrobiales bacterium]
MFAGAIPSLLVRRIEAAGARVVIASEAPGSEADALATASLVAETGASCLVLDGYHFGHRFQAQLRGGVERLLVVDDHGSLGRYEADLVLDQNVDTPIEAYQSVPANTRHLLGGRYTLVRREFLAQRVLARSQSALPRRLLVALGGAAPAAAISMVEDAVRRLGLSGLVPVWPGRTEPYADDLGAVMASCDLAVTAAGGTAWELCVVGLPAVLLPIATNQLPIASALAARGAALNAGPPDGIDGQTLAGFVRQIALDPSLRESMVTAQRAVVDGMGAPRVAAALRAGLLTLRPAQEADAVLLWEWANDSVVRRAAFFSERIPWDEHVAWFDDRRRDPEARTYVAERHGTPVGTVRFDRRADAAEIGVSVAPDVRGSGWGGALVVAGCWEAFRDLHVRRIDALIKPDNAASLATFDHANFSLAGEETRNGGPALRYALEGDAA